MPETPDFDQIALQLVVQTRAHAQIAIAEQLRQVWNARGAADVTEIAATLTYSAADAGLAKVAGRAILKLDR